jgi:segregation and condensation protein B
VTEHQDSSTDTQESPADTQESPADVQESPAESATADALESVTDTEQVVVPTGSVEPPIQSDTAPDAEGAAEAEAASEAEAAAEGDKVASAHQDHLEPGQTELAVEPEVVIDDDTMRRALEAILMVTDEPLPVLTLARAVGRPTGDVTAALTTLSDEYTEQGRGFDLREVAGGWRYYTREEAALYVERFVLDGQQARLTQAALETLAVVAYKQPVSRARVSAVRGVNVDGVMRTLISRGLVEEAGADTESHATLYRTTSYFLERMGMQSLDDLPELAPYLPEMDDMEEELAAQSAPSAPETSEAQAAEGAEANPEPEVGSDPGAVDGELAPAEELEAGGDPERAQDVDPAEIPELAEAPEAAAEDEPSAVDIPDPEQSKFEAGPAVELEIDYDSEDHGHSEEQGPEDDGRLEPAEDLEAIAEDVEIESHEETVPESGAEEPGPAAQASYGVDGDVTGPGLNEDGGTRDAETSGGSWSNRDDD